MANYFYTATTLEGVTQTGVANANDERQLAQSLKKEGLILIRAVLEEKTKKNWLQISFSFGVSLAEKIMITRNLAVMVSAGLSLVKSFDILASQFTKATLSKALVDIREHIAKGEPLSDTMAKHPKVFSELFVNMVKIGEESGTLEDIFQILSLQLTREHELKSRIRNAMVYPAMIMLVMVVVGIIIITFVLPNLNIFFTSLNTDIPIYTRALLAGGNFLAQQWYLLILIPLVLVAATVLALRTKTGKWALDEGLIKLPILSPVIKKSNSAFFIRSLSSLIAAGVPLIRSLEICSKTAANHYFKEAALQAAEKVKQGDKLSQALKSHQGIFPFGVIEMMEVGEETGKTSVILKKLADFYEQEAAAAVERLSLLIEPALIIVLGVAVGFFAISIIEPMYSSLQSIQ